MKYNNVAIGLVTLSLCVALYVRVNQIPAYDVGKESLALIKQCESKLARNEHCIILAVPTNKASEFLVSPTKWYEKRL